MKIQDAILIDFHGVLTDGKQTISHDGKYFFDHVHTRDIRAIRELIARGYYVAIVTSSSSEIIEHFCAKVGAQRIVARDKSRVIKDFQDYIAIGDDAWDVAMLENAKLAYCPSDADPSVKNLEGMIVLPYPGGSGVIAHMLLDLHKL